MNIERNIVQTKLLTFTKGKISKSRKYLNLQSMKDIFRLYPDLNIKNINKLNINNQMGGRL